MFSFLLWGGGGRAGGVSCSLKAIHKILRKKSEICLKNVTLIFIFIFGHQKPPSGSGSGFWIRIRVLDSESDSQKSLDPGPDLDSVYPEPKHWWIGRQLQNDRWTIESEIQVPITNKVNWSSWIEKPLTYLQKHYTAPILEEAHRENQFLLSYSYIIGECSIWHTVGTCLQCPVSYTVYKKNMKKKHVRPQRSR
jgi:hypothetical protein